MISLKFTHLHLLSARPEGFLFCYILKHFTIILQFIYRRYSC